MTTVAVPAMAHQKTDTEFKEDFAGLANEEVERRGKLDQTIFKMGDLLVQWQPDHATLTTLAKQYGYKTIALEQRQRVALNIPKAVRNSDLSYTAHVEALKIENIPARDALIAASSGRSTNLMRVAVQEKRLELGEIQPIKKQLKGTTLPVPTNLNFSGGFDIYDGTTVLKVRGTIVNGEVELSVTSSNPFDAPLMANVVGTRGTKQVIEGTIELLCEMISTNCKEKRSTS